MKIVRVKPPNHNWRPGPYQFRVESKLVGIGFRLPFTKIDIRLILR